MVNLSCSAVRTHFAQTKKEEEEKRILTTKIDTALAHHLAHTLHLVQNVFLGSKRQFWCKKGHNKFCDQWKMSMKCFSSSLRYEINFVIFKWRFSTLLHSICISKLFIRWTFLIINFAHPIKNTCYLGTYFLYLAFHLSILFIRTLHILLLPLNIEWCKPISSTALGALY